MSNRFSPVFLDYGIVSPIGTGKSAFNQGLYNGKTAIRPHDFGEYGRYLAASVPLMHPEGELDRTLFFLELCYRQIEETLSDAKLETTPERIGVWTSSSKGGLLIGMEQPEKSAENFRRLWCSDSSSFVAGLSGALGPCQSYVGACATFLQNLIQASHALRENWCDVALVGSTEATLHPLYLASFENLKAYSKSGSYPFDVRHDGFVAGEGAALFVLTTRAFAERLNKKPLAAMESGANGADAFHPVAMEPTGQAIVRTGRKALQNAVLSSAEIQLVQGHGTSTVGNDRSESAAMRTLFGERQPLMHSLKGATGHLMGAAGAVETAACLSFLDQQRVAASVGFENHAHDCISLNIPKVAEKLPLSKILKWSFGFGGHISAIVLSSEQ